MTQDEFDEMLAWLSADREQAGRKYEDIRRRLIKFFTGRGCCNAEDLADETISRVTMRVHEIVPNYVGDPTLYFYGVAKYVALEMCRPKPLPLPPPSPPDPEELERQDRCLAYCLQKLDEKQRTIFWRYHNVGRGQEKIEQRRKLARAEGIEMNALRIRVHHIKTALLACMEDCLAAAAV